MGCHVLFHSIFQTQGSNPGLLHCRCILYPLSHQGTSPTPTAAATLAKSNKNRSALKLKGRKQKKRKVSRCLVPGVKSLQSYPSLCDPMNSPGSSVHGIFQARILEWIAISFSRSVNRKGREITREAQGSHFSQASWSLQWMVGGGCQEWGDCSFLRSACQGGTCWSASLP